MKKVTTGNKTKTNKYYHHNCYEYYLKEQEFKEQERLKLDELCETIKVIHNIEIIPKQIFSDIQALRNGDVLYGKVKKQYKNGLKYEAIKITYEYCAEQIRYWKNKKEFKNVQSELRYGLAIVRNSVEDAKRDYRERQKSKEGKQEVKNHMSIMRDVNTELKKKNINKTPNKKQNNEIDVTSLFD